MLTLGREKFQELLHWFTSRGHPVQPHIRATDTCHQAKEGLLASVSNCTRYERMTKQGQVKKIWCCPQVPQVLPATTLYTVQVQGGSHSLPPHPPPAQAHKLSLPQDGLILGPLQSMERFPMTSAMRAPYPQANVGEQILGRAMISLSVCIGCLLSHTEECWPPSPLFWFSVFNTAPGVISHLPGSWFKCLTQSHMFGSLIQSKIWPTSCENSLYHMCCKA